MGLMPWLTQLWHAATNSWSRNSGKPAAAGKVRTQLSNAEYSLTAAEVERLIAAALTPRDRALLVILSETGVRRSEVADLKRADIDIENRLVVIRNGKGGKLRMIPISQNAVTSLGAIWPASPDTFVFQSRQSESLSDRQVNRIVAEAGKRAGIAHPNPRYRHLTCHLLRHTFARLWKANQGSIESLSKILGHSSVKTTWDLYGTESLSDIKHNYDATLASMYGKHLNVRCKKIIH